MYIDSAIKLKPVEPSDIKSAVIPSDFFLPDSVPHGYANGYVGVPKGHPWYGKKYDDIECSIHGGLTYSRDYCPHKELDGLWWVGFDTCHHRDNKDSCNESYVRHETDRLLEQAIEATTK